MNRFRIWLTGLQPKAQQRVRLGITITTLLFVVLVIVLVFRGCSLNSKKNSHPPAVRQSQGTTKAAAPAPLVSTTPAQPLPSASPATDQTVKPSPLQKETAVAKPSVGSRLETLVKGLAEKVNNLIGRVTDLGKQQEATTGEVKTLFGKVEKVGGRLDNLEKRSTISTLSPAIPPTPPALTPAEPEAEEPELKQLLPSEEELREWGRDYLEQLRRRSIQPERRSQEYLNELRRR